MKKLLNMLAVFSYISLAIPVILYGELNSFGEIGLFRCFFIYLPFLSIVFFMGDRSKVLILKLTPTKNVLFRIAEFFACLLSASLPLLAVAFFFRRIYISAFVLGALVIYFYYIGKYCRGQDFYSLTKPIVPGVLFGISLYCYVGLALWGAGVSGNITLQKITQEIIIFNLLINGLFTALIFNQINISRLLERRGSSIRLMPKNLRTNNALIVSFICVLITVCYAFREKISAFLSALATLFFWLAAIIINFFQIPNNIGERLAEPPEFYGHKGAGSAWNIALRVLFTALAVYLAWRFRTNIASWISDLIKRLANRLKRKENNIANTPKEIAYIDYTEEIIHLKTAQNLLKHDLKSYKKEKSPDKKLRLSYKIFIRWLKSEKIDVLSSDTASESIKKGEAFYRSEILKMQTYKEKYESLRYGGINADQAAVKLADELVKAVKKSN
ncbi:MAG: hypothetical protein LBR74_04000 [Eubacterium sp.]|jgi:hypothetical protein|nr:hypothetical protein [Eubacterium sp.]